MELLKLDVVKLAVAISAAAASTVAVAQTYSYDSLGRLVRVVYANGAEVSYVYDKAGNRLTETVRPSAAAASPLAAGSPTAASAAPAPATGPAPAR